MRALMLGVDLQHEYYSGGVFQGAKLLPETATKRILDRYSIQLSQINGRFELNYFGEASLQTFLDYLARSLDTPLTFDLVYLYDDLPSISDFPVNWLGQLYFDTKDVEPYAGKGSPMELVQNMNQNPGANCRSVGKLFVHPTHLYQQDVAAAGRQYFIRLKARKTQWQYILFNRGQISLDNPVIADEVGNEFDPPQLETIDGEDALIFSSGGRSLALSERPVNTFRLLGFPKQHATSTRKSKSRTLINKLPVPKASETKVQVRHGEQVVCSQMYVYL